MNNTPVLLSESVPLGSRMAEGGQEDLSVLKRKIVLVDKLVRKQQKNDARNEELTAKLQKKEQVKNT